MLKGQIKEKSIPFAYIDYDQPNPANLKKWGEYIDVRGEKKLIRELIQLGKHNILVEGDKGVGKTLLVEDEFNALPHDEQLWFNRPLDKRRSIYVNGKLFKLDDGVKFTFIATINPITYAGVNTLTESLRSRFIGRVLPYPNNSELEKIIDWSDIPDETKKCMLTLCQQIHSLRVKGEVEYVFSPRDIDQFCDIYRTQVGEAPNKWKLEDVIDNVILIKFSDPSEREQVRIRVNETFGVNI